MKSFNQIDAYLEAELTESERKVFEAEMAQNQALAYAVRLARFNRHKRSQASTQEQEAFLRRLHQLRDQLYSPPTDPGE